MFLDILKDIDNFMKPINKFITKNYGNPLFWLAIVGIVLGVFVIAYNYIHRGE